MKIDVKDYEHETHLLLIALNLVNISCDYFTADLIQNTLNCMKEKGGEMNLHDAVEIRLKHEKKWSEYAKSKQQKQE